MGTINSALSLVTGALDADQSALNIVSDNVANSSNASYTRQVPNWAETQPISINNVYYGTGVTVTGGVAQRDKVLEQRLHQQTQGSSAATALLGALTNLQGNFTPSSGTKGGGDIGSDITSFFNSYAQLESNPSSNPLRQQILSSANSLASDVSSRATNLLGQQASLDQSVTAIATQVNALTSSLAQINGQIASNSPNQDAGALEDQRQSTLSQLSSLIGFDSISTENNGTSITTTGGQLLVSGDQASPVTTGLIGGVTHLFAGGTDITSQLTSGGGQIGGLLTARDGSIPKALASLDQLAYSVSTQMNTINNAGTDLVGDNGSAGNVFAAPTQVGGSAQAFRVVMTDPNKIAAAQLGAGVGDNRNAVAAANVATQPVVNGQTPSDFYSNLVSVLGVSVSQTTTDSAALSASVSQLQTQRDSLSGVNLNEEASALQQYQRSYQAASHVFAILNSIYASAINIGTETPVS